MPNKTALSLPDRLVAALLAAIWIAAGLIVIGLAIALRRWLLLAPGILGFAYGLLWLRVAVEGRRLPWPAGRIHRPRKQR